MRTYKPTFKDKDNSTKEVKKYWVETRDHIGKIRRFAGYTDEKQTEKLGEKIDKLVVFRMNNEPLNKELTEWVSHIDRKLRNRLVEVGILSAERANIGKPLIENIEDYQKSLEARNCTDKHVQTTISAVKRIVKECSFNYWPDITREKVENLLKKLRDDKENSISFRRSNGYLVSLKSFANWMIETGRANQSPVQYIKRLNIKEDPRHTRRAIETGELAKLLETTKTQPENYGMTGNERALLYRLAVETGLRSSELASLTVSSFNLKENTITLEAAYSKHRREDTIILHPDTANEFKTFLEGKKSNQKVFNMPVNYRVINMFKADLAAAGIAYKDESGRVFDFHALRGQCASLLAASGVHPKTAQELMRHSDINLTMGIYTHTFRGQNSDAIEKIHNQIHSKGKKENATNAA